MTTDTQALAPLEAIYRCWHCQEEGVFEAGEPFTPCACGELYWVCWIDDNADFTPPYLPVCFGYGTMFFCIVMLSWPEVGDEFNAMLKVHRTTMDGERTVNYIDTRLRIKSLGHYELNGHEARMAELETVGPILATEYVYRPHAI